MRGRDLATNEPYFTGREIEAESIQRDILSYTVMLAQRSTISVTNSREPPHRIASLLQWTGAEAAVGDCASEQSGAALHLPLDIVGVEVYSLVY
jgi:hypothetical protein